VPWREHHCELDLELVRARARRKKGGKGEVVSKRTLIFPLLGTRVVARVGKKGDFCRKRGKKKTTSRERGGTAAHLDESARGKKRFKKRGEKRGKAQLHAYYAVVDLLFNGGEGKGKKKRREGVNRGRRKRGGCARCVGLEHPDLRAFRLLSLSQQKREEKKQKKKRREKKTARPVASSHPPPRRTLIKGEKKKALRKGEGERT